MSIVKKPPERKIQIFLAESRKFATRYKNVIFLTLSLLYFPAVLLLHPTGKVNIFIDLCFDLIAYYP
jgi:hypothetical protein